MDIIVESEEGTISDADKVILKADGTYEIRKEYTVEELLMAKEEIEKMLGDKAGEEIQKFEKDEIAWKILTKLYENNYINAKEILKEEIKKIATCKDVTELFNKLLQNWKTEGEEGEEMEKIERIINTCTKEGGNVGSRTTEEV